MSAKYARAPWSSRSLMLTARSPSQKVLTGAPSKAPARVCDTDASVIPRRLASSSFTFTSTMYESLK